MASPQSLTNATNILKYDYLPIWKNQINIDPSPLLERISKTSLISSKIYGGAPVGLNGGFGFGTETGATPSSGNQRYEKFEIAPVEMYTNIEITDKAIKLGDNRGAMVNILDNEIKGSYNAAKWNIGRSLFGDGVGKLGTFTGAQSAVTALTLDSVENVIAGLIIDVYDVTGSTVTKRNTSGIRISNVNYTTKAITISPAVTTSYGGFITVQNSYNNEITGLKAIFDSTVTSLYGVTKSGNDWIVPSSVSAGHDISDIVLYTAVNTARKRAGSEVNMIMMADDTFQAYQNYMSESNVKLVQGAKYVGGAVGYKVVVGSREVEVVNDSHVPAGKAWGIDTNAFKFETTELDFASEQGGSAFVLVDGTSRYRALLTQYGNLMCDLPGGCVEITDCVIA